MEIIFRPLPSRNQLAFIPSIESDTMTVTANPGGLSPLQIIASKYNWNQLRVHQAATRANRFSKIAVLRDLKPKLILVPKTTGNHDASELMDDLLYAAESIESEVINFTHYGYIKESFPQREIQSVFNKMVDKKGQTCIRVLIWDVDSRYLDQTKNMYKRLLAEENKGKEIYETE